MRRRTFLVPAALLIASSAAAQTPPSFDCKRASTVVEHAICDDFDLAWLDAQLGRLYEGLASGHDAAALRQAQRDWLASRDRCGERDLRACLLAQYSERLQALAGAYDRTPMTGVYDYADTHFEGTMGAVAFPDETVAVRIATTTPDGGAQCTLEVTAESLDRGSVVWRDPDDVLGDGKHCAVSIGFALDGAWLTDKNCVAAYCGMGAVFDGPYARE
jgi:uncharacterized protein